MLDNVIQDDLGYSDLEFSWLTERDLDAEKQARIDDLNLRNGSRTLDEVRAARGDDPYAGGAGANPLVYTSTGVVTLEASLAEPVETEPPKPQDGGEPKED
jgi:hypothetical protein